jgi:ATP-dependent Lon protease
LELNDSDEDNDSDYNTDPDSNKINNIGNFITETINNALKRVIKTEKDEESRVKRDAYDKYIQHMGSIYDGKFFDRIPVDEKKRSLKDNFSLDDIQNMNQQLEMIKEKYKNDCPSVIDILKMDIDVSQKQKLLERMYHYIHSDVLSNDYNVNLKVLNDNIRRCKDKELLELEKQILDNSNDLRYTENYKERILRSNMTFENKIIAYKRLEVMESFESTDTSEYAKYKAWMDILLSIPVNRPIGTEFSADLNTSRPIIKNVRTVLDKRLSFLERAKDQVINIVTQMSRNPNFAINAIGLHGPKGTGKTSLVKSISEALGRPYRTISLGGESDSSLLTGHGFTYVGSCPGRIIEILRETKCTNPIILFDELDKVSETHHGKEIIGNLIHMTDSSTNNKYNYDKYFSGLEFDLSKVLFIFTYNDSSKVDPILADRLFKIHVDNYSLREKLEITKTHLIKTILNQYCFSENDIQFDDETINYIVESSKSDQGMRDIKRKFEIIISRVNTLMLTDPDEDIVRLKYKSLYKHYQTHTNNNDDDDDNKQPVKILREHVDILLEDSISGDKKQDDPPFGMYI